jgi:hypothetical protein
MFHARVVALMDVGRFLDAACFDNSDRSIGMSFSCCVWLSCLLADREPYCWVAGNSVKSDCRRTVWDVPNWDAKTALVASASLRGVFCVRIRD